MFDVLHVPTVAVVENMSEFQCEECGHAHRPFGPGYVNMLKN
jgi:Mrp family chromosome partitioning ATPase